jgi:hypothetical protein
MTERAMQGLKPLLSTRRELETFVRELKDGESLTPEQIEAFEKQVERFFPGGFDHRDEANAIIAMAVRNGPLENLHAGKSSPLLEDDTLSRLTDADVKAIMIYATRMVAMMLRVRDEAPEVYRRYVQSYGGRYCRTWERST